MEHRRMILHEMNWAADNCVFCEIVRREAEASIVYEDENVIAFPPLRPINPGHTLVVPKSHASGLSDLDAATGARIFTLARRIAQGLRSSGLPCEGVNLWLADGEVALQDVFHVHLHVIPRVTNDGFVVQTNPLHELPREELDQLARQLREALPLT